MTDPKPVELLTESEKVPLLQAYTEGPIAMLDAVTAIVAAREAAARREALLEAARDVALLGDPDMATWMRGLAEEQGA